MVRINVECFEEYVELEEDLKEASVQILEKFKNLRIPFQSLDNFLFGLIWTSPLADALSCKVEDIEMSFDLPRNEQQSINGLGTDFALVEDIIFGQVGTN